MPPGSATGSAASRSPACGSVSVIVAEARVVLSVSVISVSMSAIGIGAPPSVNVRAEARSDDCRIVGVEIDDGGGVVDLGDLDDRLRQVACDHSIVDDHVDDARIGRRRGTGVVEPDLLQCRLISGQ